MSSSSRFNWSDWLTIDASNIEVKLKLRNESERSDNLYYRFYTISDNGSQMDEDALIEYLKTEVTNYIFTAQDISEFEEEGVNPLNEALAKFGNIDPIRDGKYGELLLYILTEAILKTPMVVQKLRFTYPNNQVMGADGVFLGEYNGQSALLIGESKMQQQYSICLASAISSIERFDVESDFLKHELWVSRKHLREDMKGDDLDFIYNSLKRETEEFKSNVLVYPILLVYKEKDIRGIHSASTSQEELEKSLVELVNKQLDGRIKSIRRACEGILKKDSVYLDFFLLPVENVNEFREKCYAAFHEGNRYNRT